MYAIYLSATRINNSHSLYHIILTITITLGDRNHYPHATDEAFKVQRIGSENSRDL